MGRGLVAAVAVVAAVKVATANPVRLQVTGEACSFDSLEAQLTDLAGADPVDPAARATVRIATSQSGDAYDAQIFFDDGTSTVRGPRIVTAASCAELVKAVALVVVMALPSEPVAAPPATSVTTTTSATTATTAIVTASEPRAPSAPLAIDVVAGGAGGFTSQGLQAQLLVGARIRRAAASLGVELRADVPRDYQVSSMASISVLRTQLSISPCVHAGPFAACALASAGAIHGSGDGLVSARSAYLPLLAGGARLAWEHPISARLALRVHLDLDALLTTSRFDVDHMEVWASPRFEGGAGLGIVAHIP